MSPVAEARYVLRFRLIETLLDGDSCLRVDEKALAAVHRLTLDEYRDVQSGFSRSVSGAVSLLLMEAPLREQLASLHRAYQGKVVVVGDSISADQESWAWILGGVLSSEPGQGRKPLLNMAVDGATTTDVLASIGGIVAHDPSHVLVLIGTNDAQGHGGDTLVSDAETQRNITAIDRTLRTAGATVHWLAPPPCVPERIIEHWYTRRLPIAWSEDRLEAKREIVRKQDGFLLDCSVLLGQQPGVDLLPDGLHPSLAGHMEITRAVIDASLGNRRPPRLASTTSHTQDPSRVLRGHEEG